MWGSLTLAPINNCIGCRHPQIALKITAANLLYYSSFSSRCASPPSNYAQKWLIMFVYDSSSHRITLHRPVMTLTQGSSHSDHTREQMSRLECCFSSNGVASFPGGPQPSSSADLARPPKPSSPGDLHGHTVMHNSTHARYHEKNRH